MSTDDGGLRDLFRENIGHCHWTPIETGAVGPGTPDAEFCMDGGVQGWIEYKQTDGWAVTLRPAQVAWLMERALRGGRAYIGVRRRTTGGPRTSPADELWLCRAGAARVLKREGLRACPPAALLGKWTGGEDAWDWAAIRKALTR